MAQQESVHTPIEFDIYKQNKINILKTILLIKNTEIRLEKIERIKQEKQELRNQMSKLLNEIVKETTKIKNRLPQPTKKALHTDFETTINIEERESRVDNELELIRKKLAKLAG